ncbi:MAG: hypothetical protein OEL53_00585 [Rhodospirillales bacterium]|nr:hypothetical protein [Rhodospirillales bacterium]
MFDYFNPVLREARKRAKEEYKQRLLQGKADAMMLHAREDAARKLANKEKFRQGFPHFVGQFLKAAIYLGVFFLMLALLAH